MKTVEVAEHETAGLPDCRACGACCAEAGAVVVSPEDSQVPRHLTRSVRGRVGYASFEADEGVREMARHIGGRCKALRGIVGADCRCSIYDRRPAICEQFTRGSEGCIAARERMARKLSHMDWQPHGYGPEWSNGTPADYLPTPSATGPFGPAQPQGLGPTGKGPSCGEVGR